MGRRIVSNSTNTPTATADATNLANQTYPFVLLGGAATQINYIHEISISGQAASSSSPTYMILGRDSTVAATAGTSTSVDAPADPEFSALSSAVVTGNSFTTAPQRSASLHLLNCSVNAFGGVYFWRANKIDEAIRTYGTAVNTGEVSLSAFTGGTPGAIGTHMVYETV